MNKQTQTLLMFGALAVGAYLLFKDKLGAAPSVNTTASGDAVQIAKAEAAAAIAQAQAAQAIAEAGKGEWYTPLVQGIGQGTSSFLSGLPGMF